MKLLKITLLFCLLTTLLSTHTYANNVAAGELSYTWLSGNTYRFVYKGYFDCAGSPAPASVYLCATNTCASTNTHYILNKWTGSITYGMPNGSNVPVGCLKPSTQCDTPTSTLKGYKEYWYTVDITLNDTCSNWQFVTTVNSRSSFDNVVGGNQYLKVTFDNTNIQKNSSPYFTSPAVIYRGKYDQLYLKNHLSDPDGDSLVLEVTLPLTHSGTTNLCPTTSSAVALIPRTPPISFPNNPFPTLGGSGFFIDSVNTVSIIPDTNGVFLVTYLIKEYRNSKLIGTILKDVTFVIANVGNNYLRHEIDSTRFSGLKHFNPGTYISCPGDTIRTCYRITANGSNARIYVSDSMHKYIPSAIVSITGQGTDTVYWCMEWISTPVDTGIFLAGFRSVDSSCYPPGFTHISGVGYRIHMSAPPFVKVNTPWPNPAWPYVQLNFSATITPCFKSWFQWQVNGVDVPGNTSNPQIWSSTQLNDGDHVRCLYKCYDTLCMDTSVVISNTITVNMKTGIAGTNGTDESITIFPNPNNGVFAIAAPTINNKTALELSIFNIYGQSVYSTGNYTGGQIDLSGEARGMYMLRLSDGEKQYKANFVIR